MKILHTADWHLGRSFNNFDLLAEQQFILLKFIEIVKEIKPDVVIIAGDIYDRSVPPAAAVTLFSNTIIEIIDLNIPVIAIAGNHDSAERIDYVQHLLGRQNFHIFGTLKIPVSKIILEDDHGKIHFYCVPYTEPEQAKIIFDNTDIRSHQHTMEFIISDILDSHPPEDRSVLIGHSFVSGGESSESERMIINVGGSENIDAKVFEKFNYVALGHLHRPQKFNAGKIHYSGSPLKYSFSEAEHEKSVTLVEINHNGDVLLKTISITPQKNVLRIKGRIENDHFILSEKNKIIPAKEDFLEITLENEGIVLNAMHIIQKDYPNTLALRLNNPIYNSSRPYHTDNIQSISELELFESFYTQITGIDLDETKKDFLQQAIDTAKQIE